MHAAARACQPVIADFETLNQNVACTVKVKTAFESRNLQGKSIGIACREAGISDQSYFRWRKEYGGLDLDQARRMKDLEKENSRLKRLVADNPGPSSHAGDV